MALRTAFRRFVELQDPQAVLVGTDLKQWISLSVFVVGFVLGLAFLPGLSDFFELRWQAALAVLPVILLLSAALPLVIRLDEGRITARAWILFLVGNGVVEYFAASLASLSSPRAGPIFASLFLFVVAYHAYFLRAGPREPFPAVIAGAAALGAWALAPTAANTSLFAVLGPAAVVASLLAGGHAQTALRLKNEAQKLRGAVQAQILNDRDRELEELKQDLVEVLATNHDVNNALTALVLDAETLVAVTEGSPASETADIARGVADSLRRVLGLLEATRPVARTIRSRESDEATLLRPVLDAVVRAASSRHPRVTVSSELELAGDVEVRVVGGEPSLQRVVENLVVNACEGDGRRSAGSVRLAAAFDASGTVVRISVTDDGPGFPAELLGKSVEGFKTSKPHGTGLGLYTVGKLVHASGGTLARRNLPRGGAEVEVMLPVARSGAEPPAVSDQAAA